MFENWIRWATSTDRKGGCIFTAASFELDDRPGPGAGLRRGVRESCCCTRWPSTARLGVEAGAFRPDLDCELLAFQIHSIFLGFHHVRRLLRQRGAEEQARDAFERLLADAARRN